VRAAAAAAVLAGVLPWAALPPEQSQAAAQIAVAQTAYRARQLSPAEYAIVAAIEAVKADRTKQIAARAAAPPAGLPWVAIDVPEPGKIRDAAAQYPDSALRAGALGFVVIEAVIDKQGRVRDPKVVKSVKELDRAATDAVKEWRFLPTVKDGQMIDVAVMLTNHFTFRTEPQVVDDLDMAAFYVTREQFELADRVLTRALETVRKEQATCMGGTRVGATMAGAGARGRGSRPGAPPAAGTITEPRRVKDVRPLYPMLLQRVRRSAFVVLDAVIDRQGAVTCVQVLRGDPFFEQSAVDAVRQWRYSPTLVDGVPVPVIMTVTVTYSIR
jgi:TonB family protein